ncbi:MAG: ABC transporter permease [Halobacteria archaeon]
MFTQFRKKHGLINRRNLLVFTAALIAILVVSPLAWLVLRTFEVDGDRLVELLLLNSTLTVFINSIWLVLGVTGLSLLLGVPLAYLTVRTNLPYRRFWTVALALPLGIPSYVGAFAFTSAFGPRGRLQDILAGFGIESLPSVYGYPGALLVMTLYTYPYVYITSRAALKTLDLDLVDAARSLNHSRRSAFKEVTLPHILPAASAGTLLVALYTLSDFGTPAIMHFNTFTRMIYSEYNSFGRGYASFLSIILLAITVFILYLESRVRRGRTSMDGGASNGRREVDLGGWLIPSLGLCAAVVGLALVVPVLIFGSLWLMGTPEYADALAFKPVYAFNSFYVSVAAAAAAVVLAVPVAYVSSRYPGKLTSLIERATYVGYATPGIVLGLALVFLGITYTRPLYQTIPLLIFAYVVRFLPQAVGSSRASILQVNRNLEEAGRTLGKTGSETFRHVTLPLISPGVAAGGILVFLTTLKELPATLVLAPPGFTTLVTHIWRVQDQGYYGFAAVPALLLMLISGVSVLFIMSRENADVK